MLFRDDAIDLIRKGNIDKLKKMLNKKPELLDMENSKAWLDWPDKKRGKGAATTGNLLHAAAYFNQPGIIEFLVKEKGMQVNLPNKNSQRTALHYASEEGNVEAASLLFQELGADPALRCMGWIGVPSGTPYEVCKDERIKELLLPAREEQLRQKELADQEAARAEAAARAKKAEARAEGTWTAQLPDEVTHQYVRILPDGEFQLTDIFNFSARCLVSIAKDLETGQLAKETHYFDDMRDKEILYQACAKLNEQGGNIDPACIEKRIAPNARQPEEARPPAAKVRLLTVNKGP